MWKKFKAKVNFIRQDLQSKKRKRQLNLQTDKSTIQHLLPKVESKLEWFGSSYGGFYVIPERLNENAIVYSIGIGKDVTFDLKCIQLKGVTVHGFDPTPKSINWINEQNLPSNFSFHNFGLASETGEMTFYLPSNKRGVSGSMVLNETVDEQDLIVVPMKSLKDIVLELGHTEIEVFKMDIEGSEYDVLDSILNSGVKINQFLVEFHDRLFEETELRSVKFVEKMTEAGFVVFGVSESYEEVSFIHKSIL